MTIGAGSLWVGGYGSSSVAQLDPLTGRTIRTITVGSSPLGVAVIGTSVWAANYGDGTVTRIDAATGKVTATIAVGQSPDSFATIGGRLWVFDQASSAASVIDLASDKVVRTVRLPVQAGWAAAGAGEVWVPDLQGSSQTMIGLDRVTGKISTTVHLSAYPSEVAFGFGSGWVTCKDAVYRFNTSTGAITAKISSPGAGFDGIAISGGAVWVGEITGGRVDRISPSSNSIAGMINLGGGPRHIVASGGDLWVALFDSANLVRLHPAG